MDQFPPNSQRSKGAERRPRVDRVTTVAASRKRKPLGQQFKSVFFGGDARTAAEYMVINVLIPGIQDMVLDAIHEGASKLIFGDRRRGRSSAFTRPNPYGHVDYGNRYSHGPPQRGDRPPGPREVSQQSRARQSFDDIVIPTRPEAEEVLDRLYDLISQHDVALVSDLYEMTGISSSHTDHKWGWRDLPGANVGRIRGGGGYLLHLPNPESLG